MNNSKEGTKGVKDDKQVLRDIRDGIVDWIISVTRLALFWIPGDDISRGKALMALHPFIVIVPVALFFMLGRRSPWRLIIVLAMATVATSQWIFRGCVITRAEQKLTGSQNTIIDPFLSLCGVTANRDTRIVSTVAIGTATCFILVWASFCDIYANYSLS